MKVFRIAVVVTLLVSAAGGCQCESKDLCTGATPVVCTPFDSCHAAGVCNPATGKCSSPQKADGAACNDGNLCTAGDTCHAGVCTAGAPVACAATDQCHTAGTCDPATGACTNPAKANGAACDDGNVCTQTDTCQNGKCTGSNPATNGTTCDDHNACTTGDSCQSGVCTGSAVSDGTACNDNNACTQSDSCVAGVCTGSNPVVCDPPDQCHAGACDRSSGSCSFPAVPDGTSCSVGDVSGEQCSSGVCGCPEGAEVCNSACVATSSYQTDPANCGSCGNACNAGAGQVCRAGTCANLCGPGQIFCSGSCVFSGTDKNHCGSCDIACDPGQLCSAGTCQSTCGPRLTLCRGACLNTDTDPNNCGSCGNSCSSTQLCAAGVCTDKGLASSCLPTSSLSIDINGFTVTAFVPNGAWDSTDTGVQVVPIEGDGPRATIVTPLSVNSCASSLVTHQTVCTSNVNDVYLIEGAVLNSTLTSAGTGTLSFTGGRCTTCGVAIDGVNNVAWLAIAADTSGKGAFQGIDLSSNNTVATILANDTVSEDIAVDPNRNLILSPNEDSNYQLVNTTTGVAYDNIISAGGRDFDSAAEDCTTGIALSTVEFSGDMILADLTQASFTEGSPNGTWTGPVLVQNFPEFGGLAAGTSAVVVPPGAHLALVAGEFGGNLIGAMRLQSTSGPSTPLNVPDYVVMNIPNTPDGQSFENGLDPHTTTAYTSPNSGHAFGLVASAGNGPPAWLAVIDIEGMLNAPRSGPHTVDGAYDLVGHGVVSFVSVH